MTARDGGRKAEGSGASSTGAKGAAGGESRGPTIQQGEAVDKALDGKRNLDIDRWSGFSRAAAEKLASEPAPPADAQKPKAGLARDGGLVEGES